jgi:proline dehydrogenase
MIPPIASRFVAAEDVDGALAYARSKQRDDVGAIVNFLGEHHTDPSDAEADTQVYLDVVDELSGGDSRVCISVKPSQVGLDVDEELFRDNVGRIVEAASANDVFVWIDMEDHTTTDATLDTYERLSREYGGGVGVCIQANLKRTREDLERMAELDGKVRLVKGAYDEPENVAYNRKETVNEMYREHLRYMFREFDDGIAVGSHDPEMIDLARELHGEHGTRFEVQMLMGVREAAQDELARDYDVWQYVPFGSRWMSYFYRRAMERKENAIFAIRAVLGV